MSWTVRLDYEDGDFITTFETNTYSQEHSDQFVAAREAARDLIDSGVLGEGKFQVTLSGHGNVDHKPVPGWSNDFVNIQVVQI